MSRKSLSRRITGRWKKDALPGESRNAWARRLRNLGDVEAILYLDHKPQRRAERRTGK